MFDPALLREAERRATETGRSLSEVVDTALRASFGPRGVPARTATAADGDLALDEFRGAYLQALLERDAARAREAIESAVATGAKMAAVYTEVFRPALVEVGHLWAVDEINVAQEHFATTVTQSLLATLAPDTRLTPNMGRLAVVTNTPDELHLIGAHMVADLLEREGWEVLNLGASTPAADLVELVEQECPDVVALSAATAGRLPGVAEVLRRLSAADPRPFIVVGGGLFTVRTGEVARELGADLVVSDLHEFLTALRERFPPVDLGG